MIIPVPQLFTPGESGSLKRTVSKYSQIRLSQTSRKPNIFYFPTEAALSIHFLRYD